MNDQEQQDEHGGRAGPDAVHEDAVDVDGNDDEDDDEVLEDDDASGGESTDNEEDEDDGSSLFSSSSFATTSSSSSPSVDSDLESNWDSAEEEQEPHPPSSQRLICFDCLAGAVEDLDSREVGNIPVGYLVIQVPDEESRGPAVVVAHEEGDGEDDELAHSELFGRFVRLLRGPGLGRVLGHLILKRFALDQEERFRPTDVSRMFGNVFLSHPSLKMIRLQDCTLPSSCLKLLAAIPPASRLRELDLDCCEVDTTGLSHLASMIRGNAPLWHLLVHPKGQGLNPDDCRLLCESVCCNRHLRSLDIAVNTIRADTLERVAESPASPLRILSITFNDFTEEGIQSLMRQLRTNTQMFELRLIAPKGDAASNLKHQLEETVGAYNYTLRSLHLGWDAFSRWMRRNRWIRTAVRRLEPRDYRVTPMELWPHAFGTMSAFPTLLYRLLRRGDVDALSDTVMRHHRQPKGTKRARAAGNSEDIGRS